MGRATGHARAAMASSFDALLGTRRGQPRGDILVRGKPSAGDRLEYERIANDIHLGSGSEAVALFLKHHAALAYFPLLSELFERYIERLVADGKRHHLPQAAAALQAFGCVVDDERGQLFENRKLQELFDAELIAQTKVRALALFKTGQTTHEVAADRFYGKEFEKVAGAQCFGARERICKTFLDSEVPVSLRDVTAWRSAVTEVLQNPERYKDRKEMTSLLRRVRAHATNPPPAPRRRQRYLR